MLSSDSDTLLTEPATRPIPVSPALRCTSVMLELTCWVPCAACCTLREISCVAAPCSSTAEAIVDEISDIRPMVSPISLIALTDSCVAAWMPEICALISPVALALLGQALNFGCNESKAATRLAGSRRLDGGIQRQQVGLTCNGVDQLDHIADPGSCLGQFTDPVVGLARLIDGLARNRCGLLDLTADLVVR